jgi:formamidase
VSVRIRIDRSLALREQPGTGHNRWHPDVAPIARARPGEEITLETRDGLDGQLGPTSTASDLDGVRFGRSHPLTGPVFVEGAEPGDLLEVHILAYEHAEFGITAFVPGFGFLADVFEDPYLVVWELADGAARTSALPGVAIRADPFAGVLGVAPSPASLERARSREEAARTRGGLVATDDPEDAWPREAADGLRTIPPRENGGNLDIRQLVAGSRLLLPIEVEGALFSAGDLHFAQGDGEVCGSAIEISGAVTVRFEVRKQPEWLPRFAAFETPTVRQRDSFATTGIPVADDGTNAALDLNIAARRALLELIDYLQHVRGLSREAAYILCSVAADLRISQVVDAPNPVVSAMLPLDVFESG